MPRNYRTTNNNPNGPLFFATITPGGGTALGPALRNRGITTGDFFAANGPFLSEGLYFSVLGSQTFKLYGNSGECAADGNRCFTLVGNNYHFMPTKNPENLWIIGSPAGGTLGVRGH